MTFMHTVSSCTASFTFTVPFTCIHSFKYNLIHSRIHVAMDVGHVFALRRVSFLFYVLMLAQTFRYTEPFVIKFLSHWVSHLLSPAIVSSSSHCRSFGLSLPLRSSPSIKSCIDVICVLWIHILILCH
ncbi:hypothetical protein AcV7_002246 [Taiwanofungus camphoratus]|nr:hypothetical protein AcV7_002246 [Antrodia cinnamomea]